MSVASTSTVICHRALDSSGQATYADVIDALYYIYSHYNNNPITNIVSLSFGGAYSSSLNSMTELLISSGYIVVVAMGNSGLSSCDGSNQFSPASAKGVIAVCSSGETDSFSSFSNYGSCASIIAPGENILSAHPQSTNTYAYLSGTSMSTPLVAGVIATYIQQGGTAYNIKERLQCAGRRGKISNTPTGTS
jgi:subtilisin family serine protease